MMTTEEVLLKYFSIQGLWKINPSTGLIDVNGSAKLKSKINELPVKFGKITGDFYCSDNSLQSLAGAPQSVGGGFYCSDNSLQSLAGAPQSVGGGFYCSHNSLQSLAGAPQSVGGYFDCQDNSLQSLAGLPKIIKHSISLTYTPTLPLLKLLMVKELKGIGFMKNGWDQFDAQEVYSIINRYLPLGIKGMLPCAAELLKAGYKDNARL